MILMLRGLPASGKTTYAKELVKNGWKRVNKDDLRAMIDDSKWSSKNESNILKCRDAIIRLYLGDRYNVVVDDTNFGDKHPRNLAAIASEFGVAFDIKEFDTPLNICIGRDLARPRSVGEKVIRRFYSQHIRSVPERIEYNPELPDAIICDIDGTLAHMTGRSPYDYSKVSTDSVDGTIRGIVNNYADNGLEIILVSGREADCRSETEEWLRGNGVWYNQLFMRSAGDHRSDTIVKREIFDAYIRNNYNVKFVLDDRDRVVDMWRNELGLKVLQVGEGDF